MIWYVGVVDVVVGSVCSADSTRIFASSDLKLSGYVTRTALSVELVMYSRPIHVVF